MASLRVIMTNFARLATTYKFAFYEFISLFSLKVRMKLFFLIFNQLFILCYVGERGGMGECQGQYKFSFEVTTEVICN